MKHVAGLSHTAGSSTLFSECFFLFTSVLMDLLQVFLSSWERLSGYRPSETVDGGAWWIVPRWKKRNMHTVCMVAQQIN